MNQSDRKGVCNVKKCMYFKQMLFEFSLFNPEYIRVVAKMSSSSTVFNIDNKYFLSRY